jgi:hypothetical protein
MNKGSTKSFRIKDLPCCPIHRPGGHAGANHVQGCLLGLPHRAVEMPGVGPKPANGRHPGQVHAVSFQDPAEVQHDKVAAG